MQTNLPKICALLQVGSVQGSFASCFQQCLPTFTALPEQLGRTHLPFAPCFVHKPLACALVVQSSNTQNFFGLCVVQSPLLAVLLVQSSNEHSFFFPSTSCSTFFSGNNFNPCSFAVKNTPTVLSISYTTPTLSEECSLNTFAGYSSSCHSTSTRSRPASPIPLVLKQAQPFVPLLFPIQAQRCRQPLTQTQVLPAH